MGNLGHDCRQRDIERLFRGFGELRNINIKVKYITAWASGSDEMYDLGSNSPYSNAVSL